MQVMFSEYYIQMDVDDYIWDVNGDGSACVILIGQNQYNFFLFGQPIFQGYYTTHNMTSATINFAPLAGSTKPVP